jgi:GGDEF domain-containing protein
VEGETLDQLLVAADQAMYRAKSCHKLEKMAKQADLASAKVVDIDNDELASVSVN